MPTLSYYTNVENTALVLLKEKGYRYWFNEEIQHCCCEKDGWDFYADDWTQLLGIITIFEYHKPTEYKEYWWKIDKPDLYRKAPRAPHKYKSVMEK